MNKLTEIQPIEAVTERDIDLLIIEELFANVDFFNWIVRNTIKEPDLKFVKAFHSLSDETGETDIAVLCENQNEKILLHHINYFQPILDDSDVKKITSFILKIING